MLKALGSHVMKINHRFFQRRQGDYVITRQVPGEPFMVTRGYHPPVLFSAASYAEAIRRIGEFERGDKARWYRYHVVLDDAGSWRVERDNGDSIALMLRK